MHHPVAAPALRIHQVPARSWKCLSGPVTPVVKVEVCSRGLRSRRQRRRERDAIGVEGVGNGKGVFPSPSD